ncbi:lysozyme inhibitor LprI family protein [Bacillus sp. OK048]|uniref:lysozyme inhibitor LprI family protein n=1 Tax=Bacillus sp. OK048 TaxID=1882761 RepID=UPI000A67BFDD|nr:lysozyme inhibitor LprI family protein [Bacillus sp. OK048]
MKNKQIFLMVLFTIAFVLLAACGNPTNKDIAASTTNKDSVENNAPDSGDNSPVNVQEDTSTNTSTNSDDKESSNFNNSDKEVTESKKEEYLQKLNTTKQATEELKATDSSTFALKKVENDRWEMWDALLNEVYGVLKEQLTTEEMDQLRTEQRNWLKQRDDTALEASLKYKGGTEEHLEYVAVLANLTEERCYVLVANYMK